jgi:hypothetical protein
MSKDSSILLEDSAKLVYVPIEQLTEIDGAKFSASKNDNRTELDAQDEILKALDSWLKEDARYFFQKKLLY